MKKDNPARPLQIRQVMKIVRFLQSKGVDCKGDDGFPAIAEKMRYWERKPLVQGKASIRIAFREFLNRPDVCSFSLPLKSRKPQQAASPKVKAIEDARKRRQEFYLSKDWRYVRYEALKRSRGVCELCGTAPTPGKPLHVDHIKPRSKYPELEFEISNLQILCDDCNLGKGNRDEIDWRRAS